MLLKVFVFYMEFVFLVNFANGCEFDRNPNYNIYEDTLAGTRQSYGMLDTSKIKSLTLTGDLLEYFEVDPADFSVLVTKKDITRSITSITGDVVCEGTNSFDSATETRTFNVLKYNNKNEVEYSDTTESLNENSFVSTSDVSNDIIWVANDDDTDDIEYTILNQVPDGYFFLVNTKDGRLRLGKQVDYETTQSIEITVQATSSGASSDPSDPDPFEQTATATITVNVVNLDDNDPYFSPCEILPGTTSCLQNIYTGYVDPDGVTNEKITLTSPVKVEDLDNLGETVSYSLFNSDLTESDQFKIDVSSGEVSLKKDLTADDFGKRYNLLIVATQDTDKKLTANLQLVVNKEDTSQPVSTPSATEGKVVSVEVPGPVVDSSDNPIQISTSDADDSNAQFTYEISESGFQVIDGNLYYFPTMSTTRASEVNVEVKSVNLNAELSSPQRKSSAISIKVDKTATGSSGDSGVVTQPVDDNTVIIVSAVLGVVIIILLIVIFWLNNKRRKLQKVASIVDNEELKSVKSNRNSVTSEKSGNSNVSYVDEENNYEDKISIASSKNEQNDEDVLKESENSLTINGTDQGESSPDQDSIQEEEESVASSHHSIPIPPPVVVAVATTSFDDPPEEATTSFDDPAEEQYKEVRFEPEPQIEPEPEPETHRLPPIIPIPPPPTQMFVEPPRTPQSDDNVASAIVNTDGVILTYSLACQRNLCEHLRNMKELRGETTELVVLKRFGVDKKDTFAVVKSYEESNMFDAQIKTLNNLDELMTKVGGSMNDNILPYFGQHKVDGFIKHCFYYVSNGCLNDFFKKDQRSGNSRLRMNLLYGITKGISFIHSNNVVHGKLSSHTVWIDENLTPKVHEYENNEGLQFDKSDEKRRWLAPEVLSGEICTFASDIWSLGVVMWEILTCGETPYEGVQLDDIESFLRNEKRLKKPDCCAADMFAIVENGCWSEQPKGRLDAKLIQSNLDEKLLLDPEEVLGENVTPKLESAENHRVRFEDFDDSTEF